MEQRSRNFRMTWLDELTNSTAKAVQTGTTYGGFLVVAGVVVLFF
jgi:hypothetical protein